MQSAPTSNTPTPATAAADTLVRHFSPEVREAYTRFQANRAPEDADIVVLAVVVDHMPDKERRPKVAPADQLGLITDLGFDSIAITEMVFFLEDLFRVRITNDEVMSVRTVGDLRLFVRRKLAAAPTPAAGA